MEQDNLSKSTCYPAYPDTLKKYYFFILITLLIKKFFDYQIKSSIFILMYFHYHLYPI